MLLHFFALLPRSFIHLSSIPPHSFSPPRSRRFAPAYFQGAGHSYCRLDGATGGAERGTIVQDFQGASSSTFVFLLRRAGRGAGVPRALRDVVLCCAVLPLHCCCCF